MYDIISVNNNLPEPDYSAETGHWVETEFNSANFHDLRLNLRFSSILKAFLNAPNESIPKAAITWKDTKAVYRFLNNEKVSPDSILEPHQHATSARLQSQKVVLAVQDTTILNYTSHPSVKGLGPIGKEDQTLMGMLVHPTIAFTPDKVPLGIIDQQVWTRPLDKVNKKDHHLKPIDQKESQKWINSYNALKVLQNKMPDTTFISIGDREADIADLFQLALASDTNPDLLIRASFDRRLDHPLICLWACLEAQNLAGTFQLIVPRKKGKPSRNAVIEVRFCNVFLKPTKSKKNDQTINLRAVYANEINAPANEEPVSWMLLTTLPVKSFDDALLCVKYYSVRFSIELFFKTLKDGCKIEKRQLKSFETLKSCLALYSIVAYRILFLTMIGRTLPDIPCTAIFQDYEWKSLYCFVNKTKSPPKKPPTLKQAITMIAQLGGFLNRKSDGFPGAKSLWKGLSALYFISLSWTVFGPESS